MKDVLALGHKKDDVVALHATRSALSNTLFTVSTMWNAISKPTSSDSLTFMSHNFLLKFLATPPAANLVLRRDFDALSDIGATAHL